jgi:hypothetical protein
MTLLRRRPREVYRVYSEDEYLNGAGLEVGAGMEVAAGDGWPAPVGPARKGGGERRLRRAAGVAMLAGAVGTVGGVVVMTGSRAHSGAGRRPGNLVASMRSPRVVRSPAVAGTSAPPWAAVASPGKATHSRVVRAGRRSAVVVDYVPPSSSGEAPVTTAAPSGVTTADTSAGEATPRTRAAKQAEFGFER